MIQPAIRKIGLLSYPKSGNTFTRYMLEHITGFPSFGHYSHDVEFETNSLVSNVCYKETFQKNLNYIQKCHGHENNKISLLASSTELLLLIRDPIECFISERFAQPTTFTDPKMDRYFFSNLIFYKTFKSPKIIIFYEDLLSDPREFYRSISDFLSLESVPVNDFIDKYDHHFNRCLSLYHKPMSQAYIEQSSRGQIKSFHSNKLSKPAKDNFVREFYKSMKYNSLDLSEFGLERYF